MLKQKIKYLLIGTTIGVLFSSSVAFASNTIKLIVDGREVVSETKPIMYQNSVYVPVRTVSEALGVNVQWDSGSNSVLIDSGKSIANTISSNNNQEFEIIKDYYYTEEIPKGVALKKNGKMFLPLRKGADKYGININEIKYLPSDNSIIINSHKIKTDNPEHVIEYGSIYLLEDIFIKISNN